MLYLYLKAIHIIFMVTWFAGLFYMPRLLIYYAEAMEKPTQEKMILLPQYTMMMKRLWYMITWPGMIITLIFGVSMLVVNWSLLLMFWFQLKLVLLLGLFGYHFYTGHLLKQVKEHNLKMTSEQLRMYNEIATLFLFAIVLLAVVKNSLNMFLALVFLIALGVLLSFLIKLYKNYRLKKENS